MKIAEPVANATSTPEQTPAQRAALKKAAQQFEGLLIAELVKSMRASAPMLSGSQGKQYSAMFDSALSEHLAESGGMGLSSVLERSFGIEDGAGTGMEANAALAVPGAASPGYGVGRYLGARAATRLIGGPLSGSTGRLQQEIGAMLARGGEQWGKEGALSGSDLSSAFSTSARDGGTARFNVLDASGYQGHFKCNLFALEAARRGGFKVPVVARDAGWGYPTSETLTEAAGAGELGWAHVATGAEARDVDRAIERGEGAFMLTGSGTGDRMGHMAVVERVHEIRYDGAGRIRQVVFDGWEARTHGAEHLERRTWNVAGQGGGHLVRGGFARIELLQLQQAQESEDVEQPMHRSAPASHLDDSSSSSIMERPNARPEDAS